MAKTSDTEEVVDSFVEKINSGERELLFEDAVTPSVAEPYALDSDFWQWSIRLYPVSWIAGLESRLPARLPPSFKSLVSRYIFPAFEVEPFWFFGNTPEGLKFTLHELRFGLEEATIPFALTFERGTIK